MSLDPLTTSVTGSSESRLCPGLTLLPEASCWAVSASCFFRSPALLSVCVSPWFFPVCKGGPGSLSSGGWRGSPQWSVLTGPQRQHPAWAALHGEPASSLQSPQGRGAGLRLRRPCCSGGCRPHAGAGGLPARLNVTVGLQRPVSFRNPCFFSQEAVILGVLWTLTLTWTIALGLCTASVLRFIFMTFLSCFLSFWISWRPSLNNSLGIPG